MSSLFLADGGLSSMNNEGLLLVHIYICSTIKASLSAQQGLEPSLQNEVRVIFRLQQHLKTFFKSDEFAKIFNQHWNFLRMKKDEKSGASCWASVKIGYGSEYAL